MIGNAYGTAFWSIKAEIGTRRQIQAECLYRRQEPIRAIVDQKAVPYAFYRTTTHMFN